MIGKVIAVLLVLWFLGFVAGISGAVIHLLLLIAGMLLLGKLLEPRPLH
jgi:hypothetical protein